MTGLIFTIGHSTRPLEEFLHLLQVHGITLLADVRKIPRSRRYPHYNSEALAAALEDAGIAYRWLPELGGRRPLSENSLNAGWKNHSFRAYADYMQTPAFAEGLNKFLREAAGRRAALMCAEAVPWRCHRSLIADALTARGMTVQDILNDTRAVPHTLPLFAEVQAARVIY
ncbi:MAG: DUF488 domain-containing protein, partial [Alphaproteobacteria bacterium]|nr:DUF488 domain-containing protein [Alphaproteobacteria bacterium]